MPNDSFDRHHAPDSPTARVTAFKDSHSREFAEIIAQELLAALQQGTPDAVPATWDFLSHATASLGYDRRLESHEVQDGKKDVSDLIGKLRARLKECTASA